MTFVSDAALDALDEQAKIAAKNSYSPYSNFAVGAALLTESGDIVHGCNVENGSYGLACCAERTAMFSARAQGHMGKHRAISIICADGDPTEPLSLMPCGACRQVMSEMLATDARISVVGAGRFVMNDLFPQPFVIPGK